MGHYEDLLWICAKRLEQGRFRWPAASPNAVKITLTPEELALLLGGIDLQETHRRPWYRKPAQPEQIRV